MILCFFGGLFPFSRAGAGGLVGGKFGLLPSKSGAHERILSFAFLLLSSSAIFLSCILMALLILSLSFCLVLSQYPSEDQSECIGGEIGAGVGQQIAHVLYGSLYICGLGADVLNVLHGPEGVGAGRLAGVEADLGMLVMVVVGHVNAGVEGMEHPMSGFLYFLLLFCLDLLSLTGVKGLEFLIFMAFPLSSS